MRNLVSIFVLVILSFTFVDIHSYSDSNNTGDFAVTATDVENTIGIQEDGADQNDTGDFLHKHCSVSCFVIPASYSFSHFSKKKNIAADNATNLELVLASRLKRPPRYSV